MLTRELPPRVFLGRLERERHALALEIDIEDLDVDLLADLDDLARVVDVLPRELADMNEPIHAPEIHEGAEVDDRGHRPGAHLALLERVEEVVALLRLALLEVLAAGQHDVIAVLVELDDPAFELLADVRLEVAHPAHLDERRGKEAAQSDVEDQAALDHFDDGALNDAVFSFDLLRCVPTLARTGRASWTG